MVSTTENFNLYRNKLLILLGIVILALLLSSCGEGTVDVTEAKYEPKIVFDGYLYPNRKVENIKLTRNFPLNKTIDASQVLLSNADVRLTDLESGAVYRLTFNPSKFSFEYQGSDLVIKYGKSYRLSVSAAIDGQTLQASSTTTVPLNGFRIERYYPDTLSYRQTDASGNIENFVMKFKPSPGSDFYAISIVPDKADLSTFIYDNAYFKPDTTKLKDRLDSYKYHFHWMQNVNTNAPEVEYKVEWLDTWFYSDYKVIIYAADKNFADFVFTNNFVQEMDGNFHEPKLHIEGDGIGIFGSAIADTAYFTIK